MSHLHGLKVTPEEVHFAISYIGRNKAPGIDKLTDSILKPLKHDQAILDKLSTTFSTWLLEGNIPKYAKCAKITALSKQATQYPDRGKIRPIAVLPCIFKVYETIILKQLQKEVEHGQQLHPNQRGFREKMSTHMNLLQICEYM